MSRLILLLSAFCLAAAGCGRSATQRDSGGRQGPQPDRASTLSGAADLGDLIVGEPIRCKNLQIFPVCSTVPNNEDRFTTLDEGLAAGTVEVFEVGADGARIEAEAAGRQPDADQLPPLPQAEQEVAGDVNRLMVLNRSGKPLYLMPGEVIVGGKQDRTIAREGIICSSDEPVPVDVYCVEHGRWSGRGETEMAALACSIGLSSAEATDEETLNRLAAEAKRGKFVLNPGNLSKDSRLAVQAGKGQSAVWDSVAADNRNANVNPASGTFTANFADADVAEQLKAYLDELQKPVAEQKQVVGAIVAINGNVQAVDVFESTPLFKKLWPKLLKSHALDAANAAGAAEGEKLCTLGDAKAFLDTATTADVEATTEGHGGLVVTQRSADGVVSFSAAPALPAEEGEAADAAYGFGGVHTSAFAE